MALIQRVRNVALRAVDRPFVNTIWLPIPVFFLLICFFWIANLPLFYESPRLVEATNFVFGTLASVFIAYLVGRTFVARGMPGLLLFGCGALIWGLAAVTATYAGAGNVNRQVTIHNICVCLSAACHLAGVFVSLHGKQIFARVRLWLALSYGLALLAVATVTVAAKLSWLPAFFVQGQGGAPIRQFVLTLSVLMFAVTAVLLWTATERPLSAFAYLYGLALALITVGLLGLMLQSSAGSLLNWTGRAAQLLSGVYMVLAALASVRHSGVPRFSLEAALRESEERFRVLVTASSDIVYRMSADGSEMRYLYGRDFVADTNEPRRNWLQTYIPPNDQPQVLAAIQKAIRTKSTLEVEHQVLRVDGSLGWAFSRAVPMLDPDGNIVEWFGAATDITQRKLAEQALLRTEKLATAGRMAATIAHEINNPLEAAINCLFLALQDSGASDETRAHLRTAEMQLVRVANLTKQSLGFYREQGQAGAAPLEQVIEQVLSTHHYKLLRKNVKFNTNITPASRMALITGELRHAVSNIVANSIDALPRGGRLQLRARISAVGNRSQRPLMITIADNGGGIAPELREQIFEPFFTTKGDVGTGLGLWITRELLRKHGGSLRMRSRPGQGTVFTIFLPLTRAASDRAEAQASTQ